MNPRFRFLIAACFASLMAAYVGWKIADADYAIASLLSGLIIVVLLEWTKWMRPEALIFAFLIGGYVLGNRGFAQVSPVSGLPLLPGELGLATATALLLIRGAINRRFPFKNDSLNLLLLLWMILGTGRILPDMRSFGFLAVRDFAMVYYAGFFFLAQEVARDPVSLRRMHTALVAVFALLIPAALLVQIFPDFFLTQLTVHGIPLLYYKGDQVAIFLCVGFFFLLPTQALVAREWRAFRVLLATLSLGFSLFLLSRAAMMSLATGLLIYWLARRRQAVRVAATTILLGAVLATGIALFSHVSFKQSRVFAAYEHLLSFVDFAGTGRYESKETADSGSNNQFRLYWWRAVVRDTWETAPVFGQGFGADLTRGFLQDYDPLMADEFTARSPHSIVVTVLGRMGAVGVAVWLAFTAILGRETWRLTRQMRIEEEGQEHTLVYHATSWVILVSACFGVVLESPMGAIPFWIILGLAHYSANNSGTSQGGAD